MGVSTDGCVTVEYQGSSSMRVIFVNYQTSKLQYNYQSYIQVYTIGDAWSFSGIASITLSGGFSVKTLTEVQLCYRRPSRIGVSLLRKMEYSDRCTTTARCVARKVAAMEGGLVDQMLIRQYYCRDVFSRWVNLAYDNLSHPIF